MISATIYPYRILTRGPNKGQKRLCTVANWISLMEQIGFIAVPNRNPIQLNCTEADLELWGLDCQDHGCTLIPDETQEG